MSVMLSDLRSREGRPAAGIEFTRECKLMSAPFRAMFAVLLAHSVSAADVAVTGTVRQQFTGLPVASATVRFSGTIDNIPVERTSVTSLEGGFSVELPAGGYVAVASAEGYESESQTGIVVTAGTAPRRVEFSMLGLSSVIGRVIDGETKRPLVGAKVQAFSLLYVKGQRQ